jgi:predicted RND superfamily exporter protein
MNKLFKSPVLLVFAFFLITVFFAFQLPKAELDNNNIRFVPEHDEARLRSKYIDETFGSSFFILVGLERPGGTVFDPVFLNRLKEYVSRIEEIRIVGNVNSLVSADYIYGDSDSIFADKLVSDDFSGTPEEIMNLKRRLLSWELYRKALVSDDFKAAQVLVPLEISSEDVGKKEIIDEYILVRDLAREMFAGLASVYVTGLPVISATISEAMKTDLVVLIPLVAALVLIILILSFRQLNAVLLILLTVAVAVIWSIGAIPLSGIELTILSTVLPVILIAVGSAYGIHLVTHYLAAVKETCGPKELSFEEHRSLVLSVVRRMVKPVFLAAVTTFAGFGSFCFTTVPPIREWGIFASFGVLVSFLAALILIPALLIIRGPKLEKQAKLIPAARKAGKPETNTDTGLSAVLLGISAKKRTVFGLTVIAALTAGIGASKIVIDNVFVEYFKASSDIAKSDRFIREKFGGSKMVSLVMEADESETLLHPDSLTAMDGLASYLMEYTSETGKTLGFTDLIKRINQVFNAGESPDGIKPMTSNIPASGEFGDFGFGSFEYEEELLPRAADHPPLAEDQDRAAEKLSPGEFISFIEEALDSEGYGMNAGELLALIKKQFNYEGASYFEIPDDPLRYGKNTREELQGLISNYLILLSGNIDSYANDPLEPTAIKMSIQLKTLGEEDTGRVIDEIKKYIGERFPKNIRTIIGGPALVEGSLNSLVVQSQLSSVAISLLVVFLIIAFSNRSFAAGCIGIVPLALAIMINFALMGFLGIKLNIGTSMVASLSVGIGIDYTIHFIEIYKMEFRLSGGSGDYLRRAFKTAGKAIVINAVSVGAGFAVLLFSQFIILREFGLLVALTMGVSALVSLTVIPALLEIFKPRFLGG